jgi:multiple antibiotic resistance protein
MGQVVSEFITLFVVVDPLAASSVFLVVTVGCSAATKRKIATLSVVISFGVLLFFIALGQIIVEAMGISLRAFQIAGGIVLFLFATSMILADAKEAAGGGDGDGAAALAIYPLAIPAIAGPGTMLTVMLLTDNDRFSVAEQARTTAVVVAVLLVQYALLLLAEPVSRLIGKGGANILRRVMGMILASVAVNTVLAAVGSWVGLPKL